MRQIKFRAWDKNRKEMYQFERRITTPPPLEGKSLGKHLFLPLEREDLELMQFTGLLDKNGKEIYEGDVVNEGVDNLNYEVAFQQGGFWLLERDNEMGWPESGDIEIIGNIYENPELLK